jgi:type VI secretion system protein VasD
MIITRRTFIITGASAAGLVACGESTGAITVSARMSAGANPGPDGADRPLTITLLELNSTDAFDSADVLSLQDPSATLGSTLLRTDQLVLAPGGSGSLDIPIVAGATAFGIVAGFRDASGKTFRATKALPASGNASFDIMVSSSGLSVS